MARHTGRVGRARDSRGGGVWLGGIAGGGVPFYGIEGGRVGALARRKPQTSAKAALST